MKLQPHRNRDTRVRHVVKHFFDHRERWWDMGGQEFVAWQKLWTAVRAANALWGDGWRFIEPASPADTAVAEGHERWLGAAERACDEAARDGAVYPEPGGRACYVGLAGVTVIVAGGQRLVTAWRTAPRWIPWPSPDQAAGERPGRAQLRQRAAVRRARRRASVMLKPGRPGGAEDW